MNRRKFLALSAGVSVAVGFPEVNTGLNVTIPIIDTHIHLFDTNRSQGIPWPEKGDKILYKPALPERYRNIAGRTGIVGAIVVEASPWLEDNQWVLDIAEKDKIIVGVIGNLEPGKHDFGKQLGRFQKNPLFRGIRYGNLWGHDISSQLANPGFISDLKSLAQNGLILDTANPNPALLSAIVKLTDLVPDLKVVIDHLPQMAIPEDKIIRMSYEADLRELGQRPKVFVKISEVLRRVNGQIPTELGFYRERLDELYTIFGEDRLMYGSDWPNSDQWLPFEDGLNLVRSYFLEKGQAATEKYFWKNSVAAYNWQKRDGTQPKTY
ncbi:amidohydrolase [Dyadobacter sp. NIV53]|uniref:amidohydrolase family protein n=1 Tax=Dyadobacter sp. NIV53 TaxID=2861765 RepID=UPI001C86C10F|nr:amidohydrolase family protein [Dyadobacter sp. NIV53]